jgi:hypothetical protein
MAFCGAGLDFLLSKDTPRNERGPCGSLCVLFTIFFTVEARVSILYHSIGQDEIHDIFSFLLHFYECGSLLLQQYPFVCSLLHFLLDGVNLTLRLLWWEFENMSPGVPHGLGK